MQRRSNRFGTFSNKMNVKCVERINSHKNLYQYVIFEFLRVVMFYRSSQNKVN